MRRIYGLFCILLLLALAWPGLAQDANTLLYEEDFDDGQAQGWELGPGWNLLTEGDNTVLAGEGHEWANSGQQYPGDYHLSFRLQLLRGDIHLVYRMNNQGRYFIGFYEGGSGLNKQYWPDTFMDGLATHPATHVPGAWYQIDVIGEGATLRFLVDGIQQWEYTDPEPLLYGSFAFETLDASAAYVDDITVYGTPIETPTVTGLTWVRTGGPLGGLGYDIRMRPDNPDIMYVTDAWAGVFMSTDSGQTWFPANNGITTRIGGTGDAIPIFCLTIDPHNYDTIWAGTQNTRGIFKSIDGGQTWTEMVNGIVERHGITFRGITVDPHNSDIVYAAAELSSFVWNNGQERGGREFDMTAGVVYRTTDGGQNWTAIWRGDNLARYVWIDPRDSNVIYISTAIFDREAANSNPEGGIPGGVGIVKSTDGGQTWAAANVGLENLYVGTLFMHPENPDILLAGVGNIQYPEGGGVYISADAGATWQHVLRDGIIESVEFAISDPTIAYAGSEGAIYRSEDGGFTWQRMTGSSEEWGWGPPGVRAGFPIDFQVDPRDANRLFANNYGGGNFLSTDGGRTWEVASQGYTGAQVRDIAVDPTDGNRVFAAARSGIFESTDGGNQWTGRSYPPASALEWYVVAIDPTDAQHILAANNWNGTILRSMNGGDAWTSVTQHLGHGKSWRAIVFAPSEPTTVYAGTSAFHSAGTLSDDIPAAGIYVSHDSGQNWVSANDTITQDANVTALAVAPDNPRVVYAATGNYDLLKTTDGGQTWNELNLGLSTTLPALAVAVHPTDSNIVFVGLDRASIRRSADAGSTWIASSAGMEPEASISDIIFYSTNPQIMYAADRTGGVYRSEDGGQTWAVMNDGLFMRSVNALSLSSDSRHLYAATEGGGVYRLDLE